MKTINTKFIFAFLIIILILVFVISSFINIMESKLAKIQNNNIKEDAKKIVGVEIRQQNKKGTKFLIVADTLEETKSELNKVILENSFTTIDQKGILTKIKAGHAVITNNYENFNFSDKVLITKKSRDFTLRTKTLTGTFEKGNYQTNDKVDIVSGNISIKGNGLTVRNNGEYIKVKGKAFLEMLLSNVRK